MPVGIRHLSSWFPPTILSMEELAERELLVSDPSVLSSLGFERVHVAEEGLDRGELALRAGRRLMDESEIDPEAVDAVIFFGALPDLPDSKDGELIELFRVPAGRIQHELGMRRAVAFGIGQQGCASLATALRVARGLVAAGDAREIVVVGADVVPSGYRREVIYNVLSDGACALWLSAEWPRLRPVAFRQITKGYYWDSPARRNEIVAGYFPTARTVVLEALAQAGLGTDDVELFIPDNISRRSWEILLELLGIPEERAYLDNIATRGHFVSADNVVNLRDALADRDLAPGAPIVLFTFGFGANWSATVLRA